MQFHATLAAVGSIFLLILVGYAAKRVGVLKASDSAMLNSLIINLTLPAFVMINVHGRPLTGDMLKTPGVAWVMEIAVMAAAYGAARLMRLDRRTTAGLMLAGAFGNMGYLGYPVIQSVFPNDKAAMISAVINDRLGMAVPIVTMGAAVAALFAGESFRWSSLATVLRTPLLYSIVIALALRTADIPETIMTSLGILSAATVPLSMIATGLSLSAGSLKRYPAPIAVAAVLKLGLAPVLAYFMLGALGIEGTVFRVTIVQAAMPTAISAGVIAGGFGSNTSFVTGAIFVSTTLSVITTPLLLLLL